jgi:hypothetical protein
MSILLTAKQEFPTEQSLTDAFCEALSNGKSPWGEVKFTREFDYINGRTDVIAIDKSTTLLAFEVKLTRWRDALNQAYRNTSFAHLSYVVLPELIAFRAKGFQHEFGRRSVGLCSYRDDTVVELLPARHQVPIQPWLSERASGTLTHKASICNAKI